ncbi:MAG: protein kinase, partial [Planctomycetales bacterium]|nr:protein kinase [Planctomycetales bacterium]
MQDQGGHDKRQKKLAEVVTLCRRHLLADKNFTDEAVIRQFPELMPELADELKRVRRIDQARRQADALMGSPPDPPSPGTPVDGALSETLAETGSVPDAPGPGSQVRFFGDYELLEEIDRGGMGIVYKARQISLDKLVALKMILAGRFATEEDVRRFHTEARAAANLKHPHIVPVYEVGEQEGQLYFSMDYIEGQDLHEAISEHPLPPRKAAAYVAIVARAIAYAHTQGVLHRDLKPSNILIDKNDQPWITDFGLAKRAEGDSQLTATGQVLGTPEYMPPEQAQGDRQHIGPRSDVYSLGAVLYTLITGDPPFQGENVTATLLQVIHNQPVPIRKVIRSVDRDLDTICLKCLEKQPSSRYGTADELADELERYLQHRPI